MKMFAVEFRRISDVFALWGLWRKFFAHYHNFCVQKRSCLPWSSDAFWKFSACKVHKNFFGRIITIYVSKNEVVCSEVQTHFGSSLPTSFAEKVLGAYSRFLCPKMKLFAVKFGHILKVLCLQGSQKNFWAHYHDLCVRKRSCLQWSSDAFWKLFACKFCRKGSGRIFTIFASTNEAVCHEVQTDFGNSLLARFTNKFLGALSWFMCPKTKLFAVKSRRIYEVLHIQGLQKDFRAHFHHFCVQKWSSLLWNSDGFWKFSPCKLYKKDMGAFPRFLRLKTELFAVKLRRILKIFASLCTLWGIKQKFWAHCHNLCVFFRQIMKLFVVEFRRILEVFCL